MTLQGQARQAVKEARENIEKRTTHTPGPWKVYAPRNDDVWVIAAHPICRCSMAATTETKANARLISAAPDLLEAAEARLNEWHSLSVNMERKEPESVKLARSAISKAKGE